MIYENTSPFMLNAQNQDWTRQSGPPNIILNIFITVNLIEKGNKICVNLWNKKIKYIMI